MLSRFQKKKPANVLERLLGWKGEPLDKVNLDEMVAARRELDKRLARIDRDLNMAALATKQSRAMIRKPARCLGSYRAGVLAQEMSPNSLVGVSGNVALHQDMRLYHDCGLKEVTLRQLAGQKKSVGAPYKLVTDVLDFDGQYMSYSLDIPTELYQGLNPDELYKVVVILRSETPMSALVRLNLELGPEVKYLEQALDLTGQSVELSFDPWSFDLSKMSKIWVDILFNAPRYQRMVLEDFVVHRCLKPEI